MTPITTFSASASSGRSAGFEVIVNSAPEAASPDRDPAQWHQAIGVARQACARIFRDGGRPADAVRAFGLSAEADDWARAVAIIAQSLCAAPLRRAA
jgi:hypothetical protein